VFILVPLDTFCHCLWVKSDEVRLPDIQMAVPKHRYFRSSLVTWWLCIVTTSMEYLKRILRKYADWGVWIFVISFRMYCSASCLFLNCTVFGFSFSPSEILTLLAETMCTVQGVSWTGNSWLIAEEKNCIFGMMRMFTMFARAKFWANCPSFWKSDAQIYQDR